MAKKYNMTAEEIQVFIDQGMTQDKIAEQFGCSAITLKKRMKELGLTSPRGKPAIDKKVIDFISDSIEKRVTEYVDEKIITLGKILEDNIVKPQSGTEPCIIQVNGQSEAFEIRENKLTLKNTIGACSIPASTFFGIKTGVNISLKGNIAILRVLKKINRFVSIVNPILSIDGEIVVVMANYHNIDCYTIGVGEELAEVCIIGKDNVIWEVV